MAKGGMSDRQLLAVIAQHEQAAMGGSSAATNMATAGTTTNYGTLDVERAQALDYYHGRPLGNEQADRSQVVSQDFRDTVEWIKPQILREFIIKDDMFRFDPTGPNDEPLAEQESDAVNYIFAKMNNGVMILHDFLTDALILKNGYVKVWYETETKETFSTYTGLDQATLAYVIQQTEQDGTEAEIVAAKEVQGVTIDPQSGQQVPNVTYDVRIKETRKEGKCRVECVATEDMLVSPRTRGDLQRSPFVAQRVRKTRSELKELGFEDTQDISSDDFPRVDVQDIARSDTVDELGSDGRSNDRSMDEIECLECYLRIDYDGDGDAELRKVLRAGHQVLSNEPIEEIPFAYAVPVRMPHRHIGISLYDLVKDIQDVKTTLWRQALDNTYLVNNGRYVLNDTQTNVSDMIAGRPGGIIRTTGDPGTAVAPLVTQPIAPAILEMANYADSVLAQRTGISATTQGLDPDTLQDTTAKAYNNAMNAATAKIELMARIFAEGVKQIGLLIHGCLVRHQDKPMMMKLRNQWVPVDPSSWKTRYAVTVNVGLGTGTRDELRSNLMLIGQMQQAAAQAGIVLPNNVFELAQEMVKALGMKAPERFFTDPNSPQFQQYQQQHQPQPAPQVQAAQINSQASIQKAQIEQQGDLAQIHADQQMHMQELTLKAQMEQARIAADQRKAVMDNRANMATATQSAQVKHAETLNKLLMNRENNASQEHQTFLSALASTAAKAQAPNGRD